jgi:predicted amidophosphoribosyltransferase
MQRNIDEAGEAATVWQGTIEAKTTICPACGKPAGSGKFCNNCGTNLAEASVPAALPGVCPGCGAQNPPGTKFCGGCGKLLAQP